MANANARDKRRNRAQFLKKVNSADSWIGIVVHKAIEDYVVPVLQKGDWPTKNDVIPDAIDLARRQYNFSATGEYQHKRKQDLCKDYCILQEHYFDRETDEVDLDEACETIRLVAP